MDEEDYFSLTSYDQKLACTEAGKRLMRMTKANMLSTIGQCVGILISFLDLRQSYDYLKATFDILRDTNTSLLDTIKEISAAYKAAESCHFCSWYEETKRFDRLLSCLPRRSAGTVSADQRRDFRDRRRAAGMGHARRSLSRRRWRTVLK